MEDRLSALRRYKVLDTEREQEFDQIVEEASRECGTPIALISLVDSYRQWFKAEVGLGVNETDLTRSICAKAIDHPGVFVVPDTRADPRINTNPMVTGEENIRFYAGAPLITPDGFVLGTVCVLDRAPRRYGLTEQESHKLANLAATVMQRLNERLAHE